MKITFAVFFFLAVSSCLSLKFNKRFMLTHGIPPAELPRSLIEKPTWGEITQKLDNFDAQNKQTWSMRYVESGQFYKKDGPIFLMIGGEWTIDEGWLLSSQMVDMAKIHGAYMYYTEHRYYGKSYPTSDLSVENLRYLSADQALADLAHFIATKKLNSNFTNSPVVVFGGSYAGSLATWMRQKYPHLVHAAVASSGPLLAKVDFKEYYDVVQSTLGSQCASIFMNGSKQILKLLAEGKASQVEKDFNLCHPLKSDLDIAAFFQYISYAIGEEVQAAKPDTIVNVCSQLNNSTSSSSNSSDSSSDSSEFLDYNRLVFYTSDEECKGTYEQITETYKNISLNSGNARQWLYQTCAEFGYFQTAWGNNSLFSFGISLEFYTQQCLDVFGVIFTPDLIANRIAITNQQFGALNPAVTHLITIQGTIDPWHSIGLKQNVNTFSPTYVVNGTSHCQDMYSLNNFANEDMHKAKQNILYWVNKWLKEPQNL